MKKDYSKEEILIAAIARKDERAFEHLHKTCYPAVLKFVKENSGSNEDAEDLFNEGAISLMLKAGEYCNNMSSKVSTLFYKICVLQWLKVLRNRKRKMLGKSKMDMDDEVQEPVDLHQIFMVDVAWESFEKLKEDCQKLLNYVLKKKKMSEIAKLMGLSSSYVKNKKRFCLEALEKIVNKHPGYLKPVKRNDSAGKIRNLHKE